MSTSESINLPSNPVSITLSGDKSITHRAFIFAALAEGESRIENVGQGEDLASTRRVLASLGVQLRALEEDCWSVTGVGGIHGFTPPAHPLDCGNSGTTMRLMAGLLSGAHFEVTLDGDESLRRRPMRRLQRILSPLGRSVECSPTGTAPITVGGRLSQGITATHPKGAPLIIDTESSSAQLKSAALLAAMTASSPVIVHERALSRDHTERMLGALLDHPVRAEMKPLQRPLPAFSLSSPGDPSSAGFWIAVAALSPPYAPPIFLPHVSLNPTRLGLVRLAQSMGLRIETEITEERLGEPVGTLKIYPLKQGTKLQSIHVSGNASLDALDELPIVALLGVFAEGTTRVQDAAELKVKESDRLLAMERGLSSIGARITATSDGWRIEGDPHLCPQGKIQVDSEGDHRIAMCFLIAQLACPHAEIRVHHAECVQVSYPEFPNLLDTYRDTTQSHSPSFRSRSI